MKQGMTLGERKMIADEIIGRDGPAAVIDRAGEQIATGPCEGHDVNRVLQGLG